MATKVGDTDNDANTRGHSSQPTKEITCLQVGDHDPPGLSKESGIDLVMTFFQKEPADDINTIQVDYVHYPEEFNKASSVDKESILTDVMEKSTSHKRCLSHQKALLQQ